MDRIGLKRYMFTGCIKVFLCQFFVSFSHIFFIHENFEMEKDISKYSDDEFERILDTILRFVKFAQMFFDFTKS